jgi:hypothetical protein
LFGVPLVHVVDGSSQSPSDKPLRPLSGADPRLVEPKHQKSFELTAFHVAIHLAPNQAVGVLPEHHGRCKHHDQFVRLISGSAAEGDRIEISIPSDLRARSAFGTAEISRIDERFMPSVSTTAFRSVSRSRPFAGTASDAVSRSFHKTKRLTAALDPF